jgi:hypothetical protein
MGQIVDDLCFVYCYFFHAAHVVIALFCITDSFRVLGLIKIAITHCIHRLIVVTVSVYVLNYGSEHNLNSSEEC